MPVKKGKRKRVKRKRGPRRNKKVRKLVLKGLGYTKSGGAKGGRSYPDQNPASVTAPVTTRTFRSVRHADRVIKRQSARISRLQAEYDRRARRLSRVPPTSPQGVRLTAKQQLIKKRLSDAIAKYGSARRWKDSQTVVTTTTTSTTTTHVAGWVDVSDNTYWELAGESIPAYGSWDGANGWKSELAAPQSASLTLAPVGDWYGDARPTKIRATIVDINDGWFGIYDTNASDWDDFDHNIGNDDNYESLDEVSLTFDGADIGFIGFQDVPGETEFWVTKIEVFM